MIEIFSGDSYYLPVQLKDLDFTIPVDPTSTVTAAFVTSVGVTVIGPWTVLQATPGSNWPLGLVVVRIVAADTTAALASLPSLTLHLEIQVALGPDIITRLTKEPFLIRKGALA